MKIVILDGHALNPGDLSWDGFKQFGDIKYFDRTPDNLAIDRIGDAEIVIVNKTAITKEVIDSCNFKYIGVLATGYNVVDVDYAKEKGIVVTNIPTYGTNAVAQFVFALLLNICNNVQQHNDSVKNGKWTSCKDFTFWESPLIELAGKTMGIVGFGKIGQATANIATAFGMNVLYYDVKEIDCKNEKIKFTTFENLLKNSDVVSLHCPLFEKTRNIINKESIKQMKDGAILINTSRGPLIDEQAVAVALNSKKLYYGAFDVVSSEPIKADNPLLKCKNSIITPHIAWAPKEARQRLMNIAVENLESFLNGKTQNQVNK